MLQLIKPIEPNITPILNGDMHIILAWLIVLIASGLSAFLISNYSAYRFHTNPKKTAICFITVSVLMSIIMLCFFGLSATMIKGIILSLVFVQSSFEDITIRECDDYLHIMIVVAAFIGIEINSLISMVFAAIFIFAIIVVTVIVSSEEIGGADIKMSVASAFLLGVHKGLLGVIIGLTLAVVINLIKNKNNKKIGFPLIPYIATGFTVAYLV